MANNYDEYGYEDDNRRSRSGIFRRLLIIVMVIIAILLILWLVKSCNSRKPEVPDTPVSYDYENVLLSAGKSYFDRYTEERPNAYGECSVVELQTLVDRGLVDGSKFAKCNLNTTYVKTCVLENGVRQYTPWVKCVDKDSESEYEVSREGSLSDVIVDQTYTEFKFLPQVIRVGKEELGKKEEIWQDEIKYESYKTLSTTKYYRYRDKLYTWNLVKRNYYTRSGDKTKESQVNEYYTSSPKSGYTLSGSKTTEAYKWYTSTAKKEYYMVNGAKKPSLEPIGDYNIKDPKGIDVTRYRSRTVVSTYDPTYYYICATSASSPYLKYQTDKCGTGVSKEYNVIRGNVYSCASPDSGSASVIDGIVNKGTKCKKYSSWSEATSTKCDTSKKDLCQSTTKTFYYWYKLSGTEKTYYPSGSKNASEEKVYYTEAPVKGAIKDTSTKTTAYKWYNEVKTVSKNYTAVAPSGYTSASKTSQYKYSDWSGWSTKNPKTNDGRDREIEKRNKIKLQQIIGTTTDGWENLSNEYISEDEMIRLYQNSKYNISTLEDINNNGETKYQLKMFVRNKKESK